MRRRPVHDPQREGGALALAPLACRLFVVALLVFLTVPRMAQRGMFGDGLLYATVARNLAIGVGSFWAPTYTRTTWVELYEHPPLGFALEAAAFWLLGDHLYVERLFSLLVFGLHALVVIAIWRRVQPAAYDWLPLLFWILPSIVTWSAINNMLENTQALLTSAAVLLLVIGRTDAASSATIRGAAAGIAIVAAVLTKGPVGFFPLAAPALLPLLPVGLRPKRLRLMTAAMIVAVAMCGVALAAYEPSRRALTKYVETQVAPALQGDRDVTEDRFPVVRHVVIGIVGRMSVLLALLWFLARRRGVNGQAVARIPAIAASAGVWDLSRPRGAPAVSRLRWAPFRLGLVPFRLGLAPFLLGLAPFLVGLAPFLLGLALCASLPIAFSPKLAGHYFVPSVPLFALGFASLALRPAAALTMACGGRRGCRRVLHALAIALLAASGLVPMLYGPLGRRDAALLRDLDAIGAAIPRGMTIGSCRHPRAAHDWCLHSYVQRWYRVSLDARDAPVNGWLLQTDDGPCRSTPRARDGRGAATTCAPPASCTLVARGDVLALFRCGS